MVLREFKGVGEGMIDSPFSFKRHLERWVPGAEGFWKKIRLTEETPRQLVPNCRKRPHDNCQGTQPLDVTRIDV